ncbi:MAG: hypothetical protein AAB772_01470 [Patescibacteria group bacterium]
MKELILFNYRIAKKVQGVCVWIERKTKINSESLERFFEFGLIAIFLIMLLKTKYYNIQYELIKIFFSNPITKIILFLLILSGFILMIFPPAKELKIKMHLESVKQFPAWYQIRMALFGGGFLIFGFLLAIPMALMERNYLEALFLICIIILNILDYNYYPTAHDK